MTGKDYSFIAYIDESGGDDFNHGSSKWFVLSAFIVRASRDSELVSLKKEITKELSSQMKNLHMKDIKDVHKQSFVAKKTSEVNAKCITVLSNKNNLTACDFANTKNSYYWWCSRLLIERISKCCSELRRDVPEGNGKVKIIFSNRGGMLYQDFRDYMQKIKTDDFSCSCRNSSINWNIVDIDIIESLDHSARAGLQFADVVAYSNFKAVEKHPKYDIVTLDLVKHLKKITYNKKGVYLNQGVKIMPRYDDIEDKPIEYYDLFKE